MTLKFSLVRSHLHTISHLSSGSALTVLTKTLSPPQQRGEGKEREKNTSLILDFSTPFALPSSLPVIYSWLKCLFSNSILHLFPEC